MRSLHIRSLLLIASLGAVVLSGCAVQNTIDGEDESSAESAGALSAYGESLTGAYKFMGPGGGDFTWIVLQNDGRYFTETQIFCIKAPCINPREEGKFIGYKPKAGSKIGQLRLVPKKGTTHVYQVSLGEAHVGFKLSGDHGASWATYDTVGTFCDTAADCEGQDYIHIMCVGHATCDSSAQKCGYACGVKCDYTKDTSKTYVGKSADECSRIKFACTAGTTYFSDGCGCGCQTIKSSPCIVSGCSGQICADTSVITTCEWRPQYACYAKATCERDSSGACGWRKTPELSACLASGT